MGFTVFNEHVRNGLRLAWARLAPVAPLTVTFIAAAAAMPTCEGTYAATALQPLPAQITVGLDIHDNSPRNQMLAERFLAGVRDAGVTVGAEANVLLHINTSRLGETTDRRGDGTERSYSELSGLSGGPHVSLPPMPTTRLAAPRKAPTPPLMVLRIDATVGQDPRIVWIASVQCRMIGSDDGQLAHDLGQIIGSALGKRIERRPL